MGDVTPGACHQSPVTTQATETLIRQSEAPPGGWYSHTIWTSICIDIQSIFREGPWPLYSHLLVESAYLLALLHIRTFQNWDAKILDTSDLCRQASNYRWRDLVLTNSCLEQCLMSSVKKFALTIRRKSQRRLFRILVPYWRTLTTS